MDHAAAPMEDVIEHFARVGVVKNLITSRWYEETADDLGITGDARETLRPMAREAYLQSLIQLKMLASTAYQKASLLAPAPLDTQFAELGAIDYRHLTQLRVLLADAYYGHTPYPDLASRGRSQVDP